MSEVERLRKLMAQATGSLPLYEARNILPRRDNGWTVFDRADPDPTLPQASMMDERTAKLLVAAPILLRWLEGLAKASSLYPPPQELVGKPEVMAMRNALMAAALTSLLPGLTALREFIDRREATAVAFPGEPSEPSEGGQ
jgi:hypothetical protein